VLPMNVKSCSPLQPGGASVTRLDMHPGDAS
jgi:hypothetical protein